MKSGKAIFNVNKPIFEYKNKEFFQHLSEKYTSSLTAENEEDEHPFEKEFLNAICENEKDTILEENGEELTKRSEEDQNKISKISSANHKKDLPR